MASDRLGADARRDLLDAKHEHEYWLQRWRVGRHCRVGCDDEEEQALRECLEEAYHGLLRVAWARTAEPGMAGEAATVLGVSKRTIQRYRDEYRRRLAKH